jgi:hypothetical protein
LPKTSSRRNGTRDFGGQVGYGALEEWLGEFVTVEVGTSLFLSHPGRNDRYVPKAGETRRHVFAADAAQVLKDFRQEKLITDDPEKYP